MLNVAVGVIRNEQGDVLISQRAEQAHQGGLWEFPGGKLEARETTFQALKRELSEELGVNISRATPLVRIKHQYTDVEVMLEVLVVTSYEGEARGLEGQPVKWVNTSELKNYNFPAANQRIIRALQLSKYYPIIDSRSGTSEQLLEQLKYLIGQGYTMVQLRAKGVPYSCFKSLAIRAIKMSKAHGVNLYLNSSISTALKLGATGVHLSSKRLSEMTGPIKQGAISLAVSCHGEESLKKAARVAADFAVLSAVKATTSHPSAKPLGWAKFSTLAENAYCPVYALGGVGLDDIKIAESHGAQGVAGISGFLI
ncbi:MAG: DNA mismatch repair protein MutT [Piscirickettsiaceae bacterium]|nr:MAG: DNA mismatch repair protein MutT [Piscirickettsiaceae bacterium]